MNCEAPLLVIRHAPVKDVGDVCIGSTDLPLVDDYEPLVADAAKRLSSFRKSVIISSDLLRASKTATALAGHLDAERVVFDERLRERSFGAWEGKSMSVCRASHPDMFDSEGMLHEHVDAFVGERWSLKIETTQLIRK